MGLEEEEEGMDVDGLGNIAPLFSEDEVFQEPMDTQVRILTTSLPKS